MKPGTRVQSVYAPWMFGWVTEDKSPDSQKFMVRWDEDDKLLSQYHHEVYAVPVATAPEPDRAAGFKLGDKVTWPDQYQATVFTIQCLTKTGAYLEFADGSPATPSGAVCFDKLAPIDWTRGFMVGDRVRWPSTSLERVFVVGALSEDSGGPTAALVNDDGSAVGLVYLSALEKVTDTRDEIQKAIDKLPTGEFTVTIPRKGWVPLENKPWASHGQQAEDAAMVAKGYWVSSREATLAQHAGLGSLLGRSANGGFVAHPILANAVDEWNGVKRTPGLTRGAPQNPLPLAEYLRRCRLLDEPVPGRGVRMDEEVD